MKGKNSIYEFGPFRLDPVVRRFERDGRVVPLTSKVFDILLLLVRRRGSLVTKEELMSEIWPDRVVEENNLTVSMSSLRRSLGESYRQNEYIETVPGRGYRFVARAWEVASGAEARASGGHAALLAGADSGEDDSRIKYLAVLPLVNAGADASLDYLIDGIAGGIINRLSQLPSLRVLARSTVFRYKGQPADPLDVGRELSVHIVLAGRVYRRGDDLNVGLELIDTADGSQVWGEQYQRNFRAAMTLSAEVVEDLTKKLDTKLTGAQRRRLTKLHTDKAEAYQLYLKGRYLLRRRTEESLGRAIAYFQRAAEVDPNYALAYVGLADCLNLLISYGAHPPREVFPRIEEAALHALSLDDKLAEAHTTIGHVNLIYKWDRPAAERAYRRSIELNPNYSTAHHWYALLLHVLGRLPESAAELRMAQKLDPLSPNINVSIGTQLFHAGRYDEAYEQLRETLVLEPDFHSAYAWLGQVLAAKGDYEGAIAAARRSVELSNSPEALSLLGYVYTLAGQTDRAMRVIQELRRKSKERFVDPSLSASIYAALGRKDAAFECLERAYDCHSEAMSHLNIDWRLNNLRDDPRFDDLLKRVGF